MEKLKKVSPFRLSSLLRFQKDPKQALNLFLNPNPNSKPDPKPFRHSLLSYDLIITKLGRAKLFDELEQIVKQLKRETRFAPKEIIFCNIITYYGRSRMPDRAIQLYDQIPSFRCQRTVKSYNSLLNALLNCRDFERMREYFLGIDRYACPDACTYNILINSCCLCDDLDNAWNLFDEMLRKRISPNVVTFGTLINGLCVNSLLDEAFRLKDDMVKVFGVKPNSFIYASLIKGFCKVNELSLALKLKDEMLKSELQLDSAIYSTLMSAFFKVGRKEEAFGTLEEMRKNGCKPDTVTYNAMIFGFCKENDFDAALGILNQIGEKGFKPDIISYNIIISGFCRERRWREASELFEDMPRRRCAPDVVTYRTLFDGLCDAMQFKEAAFILDEMVFKGYVPRSASLNNFVAGLLREGNVKLFETVLGSLAKGKCIDVGIWDTVISIECKKDKLSSVSELFDALNFNNPVKKCF